MPDEQDLLARIEKLEAQNLRLKLVGGLCIAVLATLFLVERLGTKTTLEANEFLLKDHAGRVMARLNSTNLGTCLEILGKGKVAGAQLCAGDDYGSSLLLTNYHGESRAFLTAGSKLYEGVANNLAPSLIIAEADGKNLVSATVGTDTKLLVGHGTQENSVLLSVPQNKPTMSLLGKNGKPLWSTP